MPTIPFIRFLVIQILTASLVSVFTIHATFASVAPLRAFVSVAPQRIMVQRLAGPLTQVDVLVQPGQDPHTYEPTAHLVARLAKADVYIRIGVPFENVWITRIRALNPQMEILDLSAGIFQHSEQLYSEPKTELHSELDPHLWTSPPLMRQMGLRLRDYLIQRDPSNQAIYNSRYIAFNTDVDALERDIRATLDTAHRPCRFIVFHPAWGYFAAAYGLTQIAIEHNGKTPGAKTLGELIEQAKRWGLKTVFAQPQFDRKSAQTLAEAINGRIEILDPMAEDYFGNLRQVARQIAGACK